MKSRYEIWMAVNRAVNRRRLRIEDETPPPSFIVTIEGEAVTVEDSNVTLSEA